MSLRCVSFNFAGASPSAVFSERRLAAEKVASEMRSREIDIVFAQEAPDRGWLDAWTDAGFEIAVGAGPAYKVRSAVLWRKGLPISRTTLSTATYHGSYLAAATYSPDGRDPVVLVSVHASPNTVKPDELATWDSLVPDVVPARPRPRAGAGKDAGKWFDSDMVLGTLASTAGTSGSLPVSRHVEVLAAGDFNECREWDNIQPGNWGADYFDQAAAAGFVDITWRDWEAEIPSCLAAGRQLQLDHLLATQDTASRISDPEVAPLDLAAIESGDASDHAPIYFNLA